MKSTLDEISDRLDITKKIRELKGIMIETIQNKTYREKK